MQKKYIVQLSEAERQELGEAVKKFKGWYCQVNGDSYL
jgi:hypothetical protein